MLIETLEPRQLMSTTYPVNFNISTPKLTATASGSITVDAGTVTLTGTLSGTFNGTAFSFSGTEILGK